MTIGMMMSGLAGSMVGFFGTLLAGQAWHLALINYSLVGMCTAVTFLLLATPSLSRA